MPYTNILETAIMPQAKKKATRSKSSFIPLSIMLNSINRFSKYAYLVRVKNLLNNKN